jgi:hypothetical protein
LSRERKSMSMEKKRKKEKIYMWKKKYVNERKKNEWKRRERWGSNKDMRRMDQVKEKKNKV